LRGQAVKKVKTALVFIGMVMIAAVLAYGLIRIDRDLIRLLSDDDEGAAADVQVPKGPPDWGKSGIVVNEI
jgi:hypothetical protein